MADEEVGEAALLLEIAQQVDDLRLHRHVEGRGRLVQHDEFRFQHHGAGDGDALSLPAGKLVGVAVHDGGIEPGLGERAGHRLAAVEVAQLALVQHEALADDVDDREPRRQRAIGILEHHLHVAAQRAHRREAKAFDRFAEIGDAALRRDQPQNGEAERRLARAGLADDADRLPLADHHADAVHRLHRTDGPTHQPLLDREPDFQVVHRNDGLGARVGSRCETFRLGGEQGPRVRMFGRGKDGLRRTGFDDPALLHDGDVVGEAADDAEIMGDEQHRHAVARLQSLQQGEDLRLHRDVERGRRFVGDEEVWPVGERHGDHHALALPAGELVRIAAEPLAGIANADLFQQLHRARTDGLRAARAVDRQDLADLPLDRVQRIERGHRLLEDHGDRRAAQPAQAFLAAG